MCYNVGTASFYTNTFVIMFQEIHFGTTYINAS